MEAKTKTGKIKIKISKIIVSFILAIFILVFFNIQSVSASTLGISPSTGSYRVGAAFSVTVYVASSDQEMNAVSGTITYPGDKLEVTSVSTSGSMVDLWVPSSGPTYGGGSVNFEGVSLSPFKGGYTKVLVISFRTKAVGSALLNFSSGSVLAYDGLGTNILSGLGSARFEIDVLVDGPAAPDAETPAVVGGTPFAPQITSPTHPSSDFWYNVSTAEFNWNVSKNITSSQLLVGEKPKESPTVNYVPPINYKKIVDLENGTWYFHVRLRNPQGWGDITHFRFQIDTQNPEYFNISQVENKDFTYPKAKFNFDALDTVSGISHYEIIIDGEKIEEWIDDGEHIYETPLLEPGDYKLIVKAIDRAGNFLTNFAEFNIKPIQAPEITEYPKRLQSREIMIVRGHSYLDSEVKIWLQKDKDEAKIYVVSSNEKGDFEFISEDDLYNGVYKLWASVTDQRGAKSENSEKIKIIIERPKLLQIGSMAIDVLAVIIPLVALVFFLIFIYLFMLRKFKLLRARIRKETKDVETVLHKEIRSIKKKLEKHLELFKKVKKKRKLTKEEEKIVIDLKRSLSQIEKKVNKEISDIKKQVK